ncbi:hypothetical protein [Nocardioides daeguensis]|uniref:Uncharacterized protein n=1 Tax=Nocardioides daeguensis TaxID=908359 RepID=A0ABP6VNU8_9ACTN|nr:hypothetical protein [Nocardioides daeguensis]MBV6727403.1 hypothetical protein [Nocardioides daeguensis]MCR1775493.1 hypothetical protein [Nocardioides daeguensis]
MRPIAACALVLSVTALGACGDGAADRVDGEVEKVTRDRDVDLKGNSPLDAIGYAIVATQSSKYRDYEIDGETVRLLVHDGVELAGSECLIIDAATSADHPDAFFVIVTDGEEIAC